MLHSNLSRWSSALFALGLSMIGCTTTGEVVGQLQEPNAKQEPVVLQWKSALDNPLSGTISGTLPDDVHYTGKYFEVVKTTPVDIYAPLWDGWTPYWSAWTVPGHGADELDAQGFMKVYTGKVLANLQSDDASQKLRCRFTLDEPRSGLAGGGTGDCQLSNGQHIEHARLVKM